MAGGGRRARVALLVTWTITIWDIVRASVSPSRRGSAENRVLAARDGMRAELVDGFAARAAAGPRPARRAALLGDAVRPERSRLAAA